MKRLMKLWSGIKNFFYFFNSLKNLFQKKEKNMALKDTWVNKVDGVDVSSANDINEVAQAVIDLEEESGSLPDLAANEGEKGFIKNRTHYIDKDGNVHKLPIEFIPEGVAKEEYVDNSVKALFVPRRLSDMVSDKYHRTVEDDEKEKWNNGIVEQWDITQNYTASSTVVIAQQSVSGGIWMNREYDIEPGIPYAVYINGTVYFCIAGEEDDTIYLGNPTLFYSASTQPHNNEPFCITWAGGNATAGMFHKDDTLSYPLTLKVTRATVTTEKKLPKSYLPNDVALKSDIPEGGGGADIDVVAEVGQTIVVEEVDVDGKPTKWKAAEYQPRTHWREKAEVQPETEVAIDPDTGFGVFVPDFEPENKTEYAVYYNGTKYVCTSFEMQGQIGFGNLLAIGQEDTGEPFLCAYDPGVGMMVVPLDGLTSVTLSIEGDAIIKLPTKYLDETWAKDIASSVFEAAREEFDAENARQDQEIQILKRRVFPADLYLEDFVDSTPVDAGWIRKNCDIYSSLLLYSIVMVNINFTESSEATVTPFIDINRLCYFTRDRLYASTYFVHLLDTTETENNAIAVRIIVRKGEVMFRMDTITL